MSDGTNISIGFNTKEAQQEIKALGNSMKQTQNEFKVTDATLKTTGSSLDRLQNKYKSLSTQLNQQSQITQKYKQMVEQASKAQDAARQRLERANEAYNKGKTSLKANSDEMKKLKDEVKKAESAVKTADTNFNRFSNNLSKSQLAEANLRNELKQTTDELKKQSQYITQVKNKYSELQDKTAGVRNGLTKVGNTLTATVTAPLVAAGTAAVKQYMDLNKKLANIATLSIGDERLQELKKGIQDVAIETAKYTDDIADGTYQVISAFGDADDTIDKVRINAKAAKAGLATTTDSINLTSAVTKGYGDTTAEAVEHVADLAFKTVELGQTTFPELASSIGKVVPQSKALGVSQDELFTIFATLTGVTGTASEVSTQLGAVYTGLMTPTEALKKKLNSLGYESGFAMVKANGFSGAMKILAEATGGSEEKLTELFSSKEAITAMLALTGAQADTFSEKLEKMGNAAGASEEAFKKQSEGVNKSGFTFEQAMVKMQVAAQKFGESAAPFIDKAADAVSSLADWLSGLSDEDCDRLLKIGTALAIIGPALSLTSKGISFANGIKSLFSFTKVAGEAATAAEAAGAAAETAGAAGAEAMAGAGAAAAEAGATGAEAMAAAEGAAASATGAGGVGGFLAALGSVAGVSAGIAVAATAPFAATLAVAKIAGDGIEKYHQKLSESGSQALEMAQEYSEKAKTAYDMSVVADTVDAYIARYKELTDLKNSGQQTDESEQERKELEQWFIDNYGDFISAEEKKNGVRSSTLDIINQIVQAQKEQAEQEKKQKQQEIKDDSSKKRKDAQKSSEEIPKLQSVNNETKQRIENAKNLSTELETLKTKYDAINRTMSGPERRAAVDKLREDNKDIFNSYQELTGGPLNFDSLGKAIDNISEQTAEWENNVANNEERIKKHQESIEKYKEALITLQNEVTKEAVNKSGFSSITDIFASGDEQKINKAINDVVTQCQLLGMTTTETSLQVALFKNGFSNLSEAMASGDKNMKAVVTDLNDYMHSVLGLPDNIEISINAEGDITMIDKTKDGVEEIDGQSAEVSVSVDGGESEQTIMTLQELIDTYGATQAVAILQADNQATVTIDGVVYQLAEYNQKTGIATLKANDSEAVITINTTTGEVDKFDNLEGTATLKADGTNAAVVIDSLTSKAKGFEKTYTAHFTVKSDGTVSSGFFNSGQKGFFANGTESAPEGPAVINDEKGVADPRELVKHKGQYYLFNGRNVLVNLSKGDSVYTAKQTKAMLKKLPHYATGTNNTAFETKKEDFEYRQKTSVVSDADALLWWKKILEEFANDADVVKEANIEIYELNKKINDDAIKDYKNRLKNQESKSKNWIDYEVKMHNLSVDEQIAAYQRMDDNYLNTLTEMTENTEMTADELQDVWDEYYETIRNHEMQIADLRKKKLDELDQQSLDYIAERTYFNDWEQYDDSPEAAYQRIMERNSQALQDGEITEEEYNEKMTTAGQKLYEGRLENSKKWLQMQKKYGAISEQEYQAGLNRVKDYTQKYYEQGMISGKYYYEAMDDANSNLFDSMSETLENYVNEYYDAQKEMLSAKKEAIETEYKAIEDAETKAERKKELSELEAEREKYQNAVTIDGKKKLKEIEEDIADIKKTEAKETREAEKQAKLDAIEDENEALEKEQSNTLKGLSKYTSQALGIISGGNDDMTKQFNSVLKSYNQQQEQLATTGYNTISKIVDMTNQKLSEIGQNIPNATTAHNEYTITIKQDFNNTITDETTAMAYGKYAGSSVKRSISDAFLGVEG